MTTATRNSRRTGAPWARWLVLALAVCWVGRAPAEAVFMNFRDADIRSVIESVAEITGRSFVIDPRVKGKLTIISPDAIETDMLYEVFLSALQVQGYQAVPDGPVVRIVPTSQSFQLPTGGGGNELVTRVLPVHHGKAADMVPLLRTMLTQGAQLQAYAASNRLVVTDTRAQVARLEKVLASVDVPDSQEFEVINLENASTQEAMRILEKMDSLQGQQLSVLEDELNNRLIVTGSPEARRPVRELLATLDVPARTQGGLEVIYLYYADAVKTKALLETMLQSYTFSRLAAEGSEAAGGYKIEADEDNNALLIAAPAAIVNEVKATVRKLDRPRLQVLIEAVLAEVSEDQAKRLSVQIAAVYNDIGFISSFNDIIPALIQGADEGDFSEVAVPNGFLTGGVDWDKDDREGIAGLVNALNSDGMTNVLSTPSVVTMDNEEAVITVGQEVPFITGSYSSTGSGSNPDNPFQTIERKEVGILLKVRPQVNEGDAVRLEIEQETSQLLASPAVTGTADVVTSKRTIATNVMVRDSELLVLGGLTDQNYNKTEDRVPLLGSVPVLGGLFRSKDEDNTQRVFMVFIKPTILRNSGEAAAISNDKYRLQRQRQLDFNATHGGSFERMPELPELAPAATTLEAAPLGSEDTAPAAAETGAGSAPGP